MAQILNLWDTERRVVWVSERREELERHVPEIRERGERYRIVERQISALGGTSTVFVLVILGALEGREND